MGEGNSDLEIGKSAPTGDALSQALQLTRDCRRQFHPNNFQTASAQELHRAILEVDRLRLKVLDFYLTGAAMLKEKASRFLLRMFRRVTAQYDALNHLLAAKARAATAIV